MMKNSTAPKAIICLNAEPIIATGAIMSDMPMVDSPEEVMDLTNGTLVEVDGDNGTIEIL
jgi:predicted aconitase with swiveling domain